MLDIDKSHC